MNVKAKQLIGGIFLAMTTAAMCSTVSADNTGKGGGYYGSVPGGHDEGRQDYGRGWYDDRGGRYDSVPGGRREGYGRGQDDDRRGESYGPGPDTGTNTPSGPQGKS